MAQPSPPPSLPTSPASTPAQDAGLLERALFEVKRVIVGQDRMIERMFVALLARGHCLLEGVPGVAKTLAVETLATVVGGSFARIQFTPDLVPADRVVATPDEVKSSHADYLTGVVQLYDRLLILLDLPRALEAMRDSHS